MCDAADRRVLFNAAASLAYATARGGSFACVDEAVSNGGSVI
jgi:hypothetical protein